MMKNPKKVFVMNCSFRERGPFSHAPCNISQRNFHENGTINKFFFHEELENSNISRKLKNFARFFFEEMQFFANFFAKKRSENFHENSKISWIFICGNTKFRKIFAKNEVKIWVKNRFFTPSFLYRVKVLFPCFFVTTHKYNPPPALKWPGH